MIAELDLDSCPSDGVTVRVGDFVCPTELAALDDGAPLAHRAGGAAFASRPRFWSVQSLVQGDAAAEPCAKARRDAFIVIAAVCCAAAASLFWVKTRPK